ncbi:hypothetical protein FEI13_05965 [Halomonas urmiana]|uniref:Uncharacterized protein n=1 Tax=Halomonas urmiana TaxID=490901 RepID=A0A5R8MJB1_9GAMM|nr:hypothetical protein [Halomonas urmiana]TLF52075.1 hypothetical protein FEI13_05965 [Halomonas urmiana]
MNFQIFRGVTASPLGWACATALLLSAASQAATLSSGMVPPESLALDPTTASHQRYGPAAVQDADRLYAEVLRSRGAQDGFYRGTVIADEEMGQMRAGFNFGGLDVDFGARLQTLIDNRVEMVSVVNFTQAGANLVSQTFRDPDGAAIPVGNGAISVTDATPGGVDLTGLADFSGIALNDAKGFTTALHNITRDAIISGVVSNASSRNIQQRIDISVRLNNIGALDAARKRAAILDSFSGILR